MLPPFKSAMADPSKMGQVHSYSGNDAVPPAMTLTEIDFPVGLQVDAAQRAYSPLQIWKSWPASAATLRGGPGTTLPKPIDNTVAEAARRKPLTFLPVIIAPLPVCPVGRTEISAWPALVNNYIHSIQRELRLRCLGADHFRHSPEDQAKRDRGAWIRWAA